MKKTKPGDIFEINTPVGKAYIHYIYDDPSTGQLIRVLPDIYSQRPINFDDIGNLKERYMVSFPLRAAYSRKIIELVGYYPTDKFSKPKYMRTKHQIRGKFLGWHIIDTNTWKRQLVEELSDEQTLLSPWGAWNDTLLIERISTNWSLTKWR